MEYLRVLPYHNLTRWIVLLAAFWTLIQAWHGLICRRKWNHSDKLAGLTFTSVANVQFFIGLILYIISPNIKPLLGAPAYSFSSKMAFFLTIYHPAMMFIAVGLAQAVYSVAKRVVDDRKKFCWAAYGYSLAVVLMIAAIPWPSYNFGRPLFRPFVRYDDPALEADVPMHTIKHQWLTLAAVFGCCTEWTRSSSWNMSMNCGREPRADGKTSAAKDIGKYTPIAK